MLRYLRSTLFAAAALLGAGPAHAQPACYTDRGTELCFPAGDVSFADEVVSFEPGDPAGPAASDDPRTIIGPPDYDIAHQSDLDIEQEFVTLGCGGTITVGFTDNALVDVEGPDLYVFEIGGDVEGTRLWISQAGEEWIDIGAIAGATATVDIAGKAAPGTEYALVRLTDLERACRGNWPGADIDAVGAIGSVAVDGAVPAGPGTIAVVVTDAALANAARVEIILDASNSMWGRVVDGRAKIEVATTVLRELLGVLPEHVAVGLRVYGHRVPRTQAAQSCVDSELVVPVAAGSGPAVAQALDGISPRGRTPIGYSLDALRSDLGGAAETTLVVLISDGIESCAPDPGDALYPPDVVRNLQRDGILFRAHVVGFDITESATRAFLETLATGAGGVYLDASDTMGLRDSIARALEATFEIVGADGAVVARGTVGREPVEVAPGTYGLRVHAAETVTLEAIEIAPSEALVLELARDGDALVLRTTRR